VKSLGKAPGPGLNFARLPRPDERRPFSIEKHNARVRAERERLDAEAALFVETVKARRAAK
jgi:hypothetical protein